ncbi:beta-propeller domain-containing protein, partial [Candidatus Bathyarchaeota archaeon]|nr:beta-propeller domain-containing protein [Candidatus Bathyarchaeota archaeon]
EYYSKGYWQGAYVFDINLSDGFVLKGNVTHQEDDVSGWEGSYWVKRALYIEDILYTVSDKKIRMNTLEDLTPINEVLLP